MYVKCWMYFVIFTSYYGYYCFVMSWIFKPKDTIIRTKVTSQYINPVTTRDINYFNQFAKGSDSDWYSSCFKVDLFYQQRTRNLPAMEEDLLLEEWEIASLIIPQDQEGNCSISVMGNSTVSKGSLGVQKQSINTSSICRILGYLRGRLNYLC